MTVSLSPRVLYEEFTRSEIAFFVISWFIKSKLKPSGNNVDKRALPIVVSTTLFSNLCSSSSSLIFIDTRTFTLV